MIITITEEELSSFAGILLSDGQTVSAKNFVETKGSDGRIFLQWNHEPWPEIIRLIMNGEKIIETALGYNAVPITINNNKQ